MKFFFYRVIVCVCVCNLHVNCVSFVRVVVVVLLKLIDFQEERKLDIFSRKHNFRKQTTERRQKNWRKTQELRDKILHKKKTHHIFFIMAPSTSSSNNNASFTKIFEQIHHKDRGKCATLRAGFCFLFIFLSFSRPRRTAEIIDDAFLRLDYISDWQTLLFSLSAFINIIKITDAWRFPI